VARADNSAAPVNTVRSYKVKVKVAVEPMYHRKMEKQPSAQSTPPSTVRSTGVGTAFNVVYARSHGAWVAVLDDKGGTYPSFEAAAAAAEVLNLLGAGRLDG
jgi:hypothetical protein